MSYCIEYRRRVMKYIAEGGSKAEAARLFQITRDTLYRWIKAGPDDLAPKPAKTRQRKIDRAALERDVMDHPDHFLHERAARFGVTGPAIWYALNTMKIVKKTAPVRRTR